jgi:hypothetical protein
VVAPDPTPPAPPLTKMERAHELMTWATSGEHP